MGAQNLAVVFGPNLFEARDDALFSRDERNVEVCPARVRVCFAAC